MNLRASAHAACGHDTTPEARGLTRRGLLAMLAASGVAALAGCGSLTTRYRFRMTVEVDTPQGLQSGSSVMEIAVTRGLWRVADGARAGVRLRGEAVAVDLPGGTLFALLSNTLTGEPLVETATRSLVPGFMGGADGFTEVAPQLAALTNSSSMPMTREDYPQLVRFRDITDSKSLQAVDPTSLAASFGPGVTLRRIIATITDDDVTTGIRDRLPNLGEGSGFSQWQQTLSAEDPRSTLALNDFTSKL